MNELVYMNIKTGRLVCCNVSHLFPPKVGHYGPFELFDGENNSVPMWRRLISDPQEFIEWLPIAEWECLGYL